MPPRRLGVPRPKAAAYSMGGAAPIESRKPLAPNLSETKLVREAGSKGERAEIAGESARRRCSGRDLRDRPVRIRIRLAFSRSEISGSGICIRRIRCSVSRSSFRLLSLRVAWSLAASRGAPEKALVIPLQHALA